MAADGREEDAAGAHAQDRRDVLDQRRRPRARARLRVEAQERLDRGLVEPPRRAELLRRLRDEEVDGEDGRADRRRELARCARCPRAPRRRAGRRGRTRRSARRPAPRRSARGRVAGRPRRDRDRRASSASSAATCAGREAELEAAPAAAVEALGDLVRLGRGLEQRDGGGASRHRAGPPRPAGGRSKASRARSPVRRVAVVLARRQLAARAARSRRRSRRPSRTSSAASQQRRRRAAGERQRLAPAPLGERSPRAPATRSST